MKKTTLALALLGAMSASAMAANVTVYGVIDTGVNYASVKNGSAATADDFQMKAGQQAGNRWGLKGSEDLGNGLKAGFVLESGFSSDTGAMAQNDRLFGREANIYLVTPYGEFAMGRVGGVGGGSGTYSLVGKMNAFGTTWGSYSANANNIMVAADRFDNTFTYRSPKMAGLQLTAQYSLNAGTNAKDKTYVKGAEGTSEVSRYIGFGANYVNGPLQAILTVDSMKYGRLANKSEDASLAVTLGGSYKFEALTAFASAQYFDKADQAVVGNGKLSAGSNKLSMMEGYAFTAGANVPAFGGTAKVSAGYVKAEEVDNADVTLERAAMTVGYQYNFTKSTNVYAAASYMKSMYETTAKHEHEAVELLAGIRHNF